MPPIIITMKCIPETLGAEELAEWSNEIIVGLIQAGIKVFLYACDGTAVERKVQTLLMQMYRGTTAVFSIVHPTSGFIDIEGIYIYGQLVVMIQDSKHALKTYWNNITSGARLIVLGNYVALFCMLLEMEVHGGPLPHRDVSQLRHFHLSRGLQA